MLNQKLHCQSPVLASFGRLSGKRKCALFERIVPLEPFGDRQHTSLGIDPNSSDLASLFIRRERWHVTRFPTSHGMQGTLSGLGARISSPSLSLSYGEGRGNQEAVSPSPHSFGLDGSFTGQNRFRTDSYVCATLYHEHRWWSTFLFISSLTSLSLIIPP